MVKLFLVCFLVATLFSCAERTSNVSVIVFFKDNTQDTLVISNKHTIRDNNLISYDDFGSAYVVATGVKYVKKLNAI